MAKSLIKEFEKVIRESWDYPSLTDFGSESTLTYGDVAKQIASCHATFEVLGIKPGDNVALCERNTRNWIIALLAMMTYGAVAVPLLPDYSDRQIVELCGHCGAKFLLGGRRLGSIWAEGSCPVSLIDLNDLLPMSTGPETDLINGKVQDLFASRFPYGFSKSDVSYKAEKPEDLALISYTSGSTGHPKGVMLPYRSMLSNGMYVATYSSMPVHGNALILLPMAHMFGMTTDVLANLLKGVHITILTRPPVPAVLLKAIAESKPDILYTVPLVMEKIIASTGCEDIIDFLMTGSIKEIIMGGAPLSREADERLSALGVRYSVGYGMTECGPLICHCYYPNTKVGSCGKAVPGMEVKVLSKDPENVPGEIICRGVNNMLGYYRFEEATAEVLDSEGWLHTGDLGVIDKDGFLFIRGRKKNMLLTSNGQNIFPEEAEQQVISHSVFDECVVVERGGRLVALVYVSDASLAAAGLASRDDIDLEAERKAVNSHLPSYCKIAVFEQRDAEFEKTPKKNIRRFLYR